jgi:hypothetical protein
MIRNVKNVKIEFVSMPVVEENDVVRGTVN